MKIQTENKNYDSVVLESQLSRNVPKISFLRMGYSIRLFVIFGFLLYLEKIVTEVILDVERDAQLTTVKFKNPGFSYLSVIV